ncbi:hypothetical protein HYALB_00002531 [Hymenoscyphus albidus]|uniref:Uncharacterized protein n=1 Tax=Hymenoscyphus albidus TaxID=595503 RepID=A0A9N9Q9Y7_9HELO|nr:hypothetical protein HYALB_00002531 [Hymenoscyphus albidus]
MESLNLLFARSHNDTVFVDPVTGEVFIVDGRRGWWYTREGQIARWSIFFGLFFILMVYMVGGYMHAKKRISKGLAPLPYHRWLLSRSQRAQFDPWYQEPTIYYQTYPPPGAHYGMHPMPPPVYDPNMPPTYQPPAGASKVDPSQWRTEPTRRPAESDPAPGYAPPPGPPPPALQPNHTGASNNPYRK